MGSRQPVLKLAFTDFTDASLTVRLSALLGTSDHTVLSSTSVSMPYTKLDVKALNISKMTGAIVDITALLYKPDTVYAHSMEEQ